MTVIRNCCTVVNKHGLHTRTAAAIVEFSNDFQCSITLSTANGESDAGDMLRLMLLEAIMGCEICVSATGNQAKEAVEAMTNFIAAGFNEDLD
jgi:phosphotransferase system HPr (HPr) family protein